MKILIGYVLAVGVIVGGFLSGWNWLTTEPVRRQATMAAQAQAAKAEAAKLQAAKAEAERVTIERDETVTFPDIPPQNRAPVTAAADAPAVSPAPAVDAPASTARAPLKRKPKPRYEVMIQRTIVLPDGRIIQRLVPFSPRRGVDAYAEYR